MERERVLLGIPLFLDSSDQTLLRQVGWTSITRRVTTRFGIHPNGALSVQEGKSGKAKGYQVEQFLIQYEVENEKAGSI